jgi:transcriptional regulator with XRE-family HTH domain
MPIRQKHVKAKRVVQKVTPAKTVRGLTRDPLLEKTLTLIENEEVTVSFIANKSGLSGSTLRNWMKGKTRRPQSVSLQFALNTIGYELGIKKKGR